MFIQIGNNNRVLSDIIEIGIVYVTILTIYVKNINYFYQTFQETKQMIQCKFIENVGILYEYTVIDRAHKMLFAKLYARDFTLKEI